MYARPGADPKSRSPLSPSDLYRKKIDGCYLTGQVKPTERFYFACGGNADIWKGRWIENNTGHVAEVAVKVLRPAQPGNSISFLRESAFWFTARHPNVTPFLGISFDFHQPGTPCLVSPYHRYGDLTRYIKNHPHADKLKLLAQAASGLSHLHEISIIHGDVKGSNILVNDNSEASVTDFGLSRALQATGFTTQTGSGTPRYMAPELMTCPDEQGEFVPRVTKETDVWAFSMTVIEIFTGLEPFHRIKSDISAAMFVADGGRPQRGHCGRISDEVWVTLQKCWKVDPKERPSMAGLATFFANEATFVSPAHGRL